MIVLGLLTIIALAVIAAGICYFSGDKIYNKATDFVDTFIENLDEERVEDDSE